MRLFIDRFIGVPITVICAARAAVILWNDGEPTLSICVGCWALVAAILLARGRLWW